MLEFIRVFLSENNTHSHLSIKNNVKSLFLLMFLALCAKMEKKGGKVGGKVGRRRRKAKTASTFAIKKKKTLAKKWGRVCKWWYGVNDYIYI